MSMTLYKLILFLNTRICKKIIFSLYWVLLSLLEEGKNDFSLFLWWGMTGSCVLTMGLSESSDRNQNLPISNITHFLIPGKGRLLVQIPLDQQCLNSNCIKKFPREVLLPLGYEVFYHSPPKKRLQKVKQSFNASCFIKAKNDISCFSSFYEYHR